MVLEPESHQASVVLLGRLNPAIFHPQWFARHGLASPEDADGAKPDIVHSEISQFEIGNIRISVQTERFSATTDSAPFVNLADLVQRIFREKLPHTPIFRLGINRELHFSVGSEEKRNAIGLLLAPFDPWGEWGQTFDRPLPNRGGMRSLTMEERGLDDRFAGHFQVKIEPSRRIQDNSGIFMATNDDFELESVENVEGCLQIMEILNERWEDSMRRAESVINHVMSLNP